MTEIVESAKSERRSRRFVRIFWGVLGGGVAFVALFFLLIAVGLFGPIPTFQELENPNSQLASEVYSQDQELLGTFYLQNRSYVSYEELNQGLIDALISTEDVRYYRHSGVDARGLGRVFFKSLLQGRDESGGGSTLTQQLAKNLFPRDTVYSRNKLVRFSKLTVAKLKEWVTAVKLERNYTKNEILTMYLNTVAFGSNAYGIRMASRTFFNKIPDSLRLEESALLVGMVKGPTRYSPVRNPERSLTRRNVVLSQMVKYGKLTKQEYDSISQIPLQLDYQQQDHNVGKASYLRELIRLMMTAKEPHPGNYFGGASHPQYKRDSVEWAINPIFGWCRKNPKPDGTLYNIYVDGLKIYTSLDANLQTYAEEAVQKHLAGEMQPKMDLEKRRNLFSYDVPEKVRKDVLNAGIRGSERSRRMRAAGFTDKEIEQAFHEPTEMRVFSWKGDIDTVMTPYDSLQYYKRILRAGFIAMDPQNGYLKAYVGGIDFRHFKYDHIFTGARQVGSTIKPFLYTLAMQEGISPCQRVPNVPQTFEVNDSVWTPKNAGKTKRDGEMVTLKWGLANSVNNVSAWLIKQLSPQAVATLINTMGVHAFIDPVPSIFLGTSEISLYEMISGYSAFASEGVNTRPLLVTRIEDRNGNIISTFTPERREVISAETAYLMVTLLRGVIDRGSGNRLRYIYRLEGPFGGKTGTTQNHSDGWFMCIHPNLVAGCWVGCEDRAVHFASIREGQGASMALPIVGLFLQKALSDPNSGISPDAVWSVPSALQGISFDCDEETASEADEFF